MANILIGARPMTAHVMQTLRLANDLQSRGHTITYVLGSPKLCHLVEVQGFRFYHLDLVKTSQSATPPTLLDKLIPMVESMRRRRRLARKVCEAILDGSAHRSIIEKLTPDIIIFDSSAIKYALPFLAWKIPMLMFAPTFPSEWHENIPQTHSHFIPYTSCLSRYRCKFEWVRLRALRHIQWKLGFSEYSDCRRIAEHYGLPYSQLFESVPLAVRVRLPQLVLCPPAFDFPRPPRPGRHFLDSGVWTDYREDTAEGEFPWHRLKPDSPLVYCSFGTRLPEFGSWRECVRELSVEIIRAFSQQSWFQLVMTVGSQFDLSAFGSVPDNIIITNKWVPQIKVLRRAAVHISHGGFTSVRESIECEVPLVVIPFDADQPGIAARIVYHNLGVRVFPGEASGERILEITRQVQASSAYKENVSKMKARFDSHRAKQSAADFIEGLLQEKERGAGTA